MPLMRVLDVIRIKLYDRQGRVVFSNMRHLIGAVERENAGWAAAMEGEVESEIIHRDTFNATDGIIEDRDLLESYVPLLDPEGRNVLGVLEIYSDVTPLLADLGRARDRVLVGALAISLAVMTLLTVFFRRTSVALQREEARNLEHMAALERARGELEERVEQRTAALAESEQRLRDVIDAAGEYIWETDQAGRYTYITDRVQDVLGFRPEELIGRTPAEFMPDEDVARVRRFFAEHGAAEPFIGLEHRTRRRDGRLIWLRVTGLPVYDASGQRTGSRGAASDITEQREGRQLAERLARVLEQTQDSIVVCDRDGLIEYVNPGFTMTTGYTLEDVRGLTPAVLKSEEMPEEIYASLWRTISAGHTWRGEIKNRSRDGRTYWDYVVVSPVRDADGAIAQYVGTHINITRSKERELALRESETRLRTVMASVVDAVITIDDSGRVEMCNPAAERLFGYEASEMVGHDVSMLMPEPDHSAHAHYMERYLAGGTPRIIGVGGREVLGRRKDGSTFPVDLAVGEMTVGTTRKFVGVLRDLTERKRAERELEHARQQYLHREKMAAVGQFAAGIIHEVGNPVAAIIGTLEELVQLRAAHEGEREELERHTDRQLRLIAEHAARITRITREISQFATPHPAEPTLLSANDLLRGAVNLLRYDQRARQVELVTTLDDDLPAIEASADHLTQVLLNLVINAADACLAQHERVPRVEVGSRAHQDHIELFVRDNGVGMDEETQARAFEPYYTTKTGGDGMGLGLSLCDALVREHGGQIELESTPGEGTLVRIRLPLERDAAEAPAS